MKYFLIGLFIGIIFSIIIFTIILFRMKPINVGTIHRIVDTDGVTYMSAEFTEEGIGHLNSKKTVNFSVSPIEFIAKNSDSIMDTRESKK